ERSRECLVRVPIWDPWAKRIDPEALAGDHSWGPFLETPGRIPMRRLVWIASMVAGCSSAGSGNEAPKTDPRIVVADLQPEAPDANGFQLILPKVTGIEGGKDYEVCTWTDKILTEDMDVKAAKGFQSKTGHHVVLYYTLNVQPAGTQRICNDEDMGKFRFI